MYRSLSSIGIVLATIAFTACSDSISANANTHVSVQDQCDPASFNAAIGAGACSKQGNMTFAQFNSELSATQQVAAWRFVPPNLTVRVGQSITATNDGGEVHTFTEVVAPECHALTATDMIASGTTFTADAETTVGTEHYQCCIHPWMRATVTVTG